MTSPWLQLLDKLELSRSEREVYKRYKADSNGRTFLAVSEILRSHGKIDESLELLTQGVEAHPDFLVARVVLAREYFLKGMIVEAMQVLRAAPQDLSENVLAQKLFIRLGLLLQMDDIVFQTYHHMKRLRMVDDETKTLMEHYQMSGLQKARKLLIEDLETKGIQIYLPPSFGGKTESLNQPSSNTVDQLVVPIVNASDSQKISGFHVIPLDEVFQDRPGEISSPQKKSAGGVELDSTTLAEIYEKQGFYAKALAVYRRLLRLTPNNDYLKRKVVDLSKSLREQRQDDLEIDPSIVDSMEVLEILDSQMKFYNELLNKLS